MREFRDFFRIVTLKLFHQSMHHSLCVECFQVGVRLSGSNENDGLTSDVRHRNCRTNLNK